MVGGAIAIGTIILTASIGPERPRNMPPMTDLCTAYARWKQLAGPVAIPDPAPNLTKLCVEGP
jgi:hypothetical protein